MIQASQPIVSAALQAFNGLAGGGAMSATELSSRLAAPGEMESHERNALKVLFGAPHLDPRSIENLLDSWVGSRTESAVFTKHNGTSNTYELV